MDKRRIGFYGGTFDPVHNGHLNLAVELLERNDLDEVWFSPAWISPHKQDQEPCSAEHRLEMLRLAISDHPKFKVSEREIAKESPSYTVEVLRDLSREQPDVDWVLLLGADCIPGLPYWQQIGEIISLAELSIGCRRLETAAWEALEEGELKEVVKKALVQTPLMDINATVLRQRLAERLYCGHLCPRKVLDYIYRKYLYLED